MAVQVMLITNSYESEKKSFQSTADILVSRAFFQININSNRLTILSGKFIAMDSVTLSGQLDYAAGELIEALNEYNSFGANIDKLFRENNVGIKYNYAIKIGQYDVFDIQNRKLNIIPYYGLEKKAIFKGTRQYVPTKLPSTIYYHKGRNYFIEIHSFVEFKDVTYYLLGRIKETLIISFFTTLIIFGVFIYTLVVILRQKKLTEMKSDFINNITHEFNTPLNTIKVAGANLKNTLTKTNPYEVERLASVILR